MTVQKITIPFDEELLPARKLSTPELNCFYEHGSLRYITCNKTEVIRMIYFAVRDKDWNTAPYEIENELIKENQNGFSISYTAFHKLDDIEYRTEVLIEAANDSILFFVKGEALTAFKRNRIGICVLHPITECAGGEVNIETPDGTTYNSRFPVLIEPHQPFKDIRKMQCRVSDHIQATIVFHGDIFETEDQRNWADSSFKTYSTPLDLPFPAEIKQGDAIEQRIELTITGAKSKRDNNATVGETKIRFPQIGYSCRSDEELTDTEIESLRQIPFDHYRVEISLADKEWRAALSKRFEEAGSLKTKVELVLFFDDGYENQLQNLIEALHEGRFLVVSILVLHRRHVATPGEMMQSVYDKIKRNYPDIQVGYGTDGFFADLNRNRPTDNTFDFVSFPLCPQVHASDTRSLLDNLERQRDLLETAHSFSGGKQIHISPVTFKIRSTSTPGLQPLDYDVRQHRNFGAVWTLCMIKNLALADRITLYEVKGHRGIITDQPVSAQPALYRMLQDIKTFNPTWIIDDDKKSLPNTVVLENGRGERLEFILSSPADLGAPSPGDVRRGDVA